MPLPLFFPFMSKICLHYEIFFIDLPSIFQGKGYIETYWLLGRNSPNAMDDIEPMKDIDEVVANMPPVIM